MLRKLIQSLKIPGVIISQPDTDIKRLLMIYRAMIVSFLLSFLFTAIEALSGLTIMQLPNLIFLSCYITCIITFHQKKFNASRDLFALTLNVDLFLTNYLIGNDAGTYFFFIPVAAGSLFLFKQQEKKKSLFYGMLPLGLMIACLTDPFGLMVLSNTSNENVTVHYSFSVFFSTLTTIYLTKYYTKIYQESKEANYRQSIRLHTLVENISDNIWMIDRNYHLMEFNSSFEKNMKDAFNLHVKPGDDLKEILQRVSNSKVYQPQLEYYERAFKGEACSVTIELEVGNAIRYMEIRYKPVIINGHTESIVASSTDTTDRTNYEQSLKKSLEEKKIMAVAAKSIEHGLVITDHQAHVEWCNAYHENLTGHTLNEMIHTSTFSQLTGHLSNENDLQHFLTKTKTGKSASIETILYRKNGTPFWCLINSSPVINEQGIHIKNVFIYIDISDRKRAEEQQQMLLNHAQKLNKQLASRDHELQKNIRLLNKQSWDLQVSQQKLQKNQQELVKANTALIQKAHQLEKTNALAKQKMQELEEARASLLVKAEQLEQTSKYKSEFLANMSHELSTPLNSIIILSKLLYENKDQNLTQKQLEFARVVHKSGTDLLNLINDILDLSKIEAGRIEIEKSKIHSSEICHDAIATIVQQADGKGIHFTYDPGSNQHCTVNTDPARISQILKNLLSNAIKFTPAGGTVRLDILRKDQNTLSFQVSDTGIGIPPEKQNLIFESFRQIDGSISRRFGGTGLGLSITKELTRLLNGQISLESEEGKGSTFTLTIPIETAQTSNRSDTSKTVLIIEDDPVYAKVLENTALKEGFKAEICHRGDTGYMKICQLKPDAILLDMNIPGIDGWSLLKRIQQNSEISKIPVHIITSGKRSASIDKDSFVSWIEKPAGSGQLKELFRSLRLNKSGANKVLIIEDSPDQGVIIRKLLEEQHIECDIAHAGNEETPAIQNRNHLCIILDLNCPDSNGFTVLKRVKENPAFSETPVIVYSKGILNTEQKLLLKDYASIYINKSNQELDGLMGETTQFLQTIIEQKKRKQDLSNARHSQQRLTGKKILVVDDDPRNINALASILKTHGLQIQTAESGEKAIDYLTKNPDTDFIFMEERMPGMDLYQATTEIRNHAELKDIPIIAVATTALKEDRELQISKGINEQITRPIDGPSLIRMLNSYFQ